MHRNSQNNYYRGYSYLPPSSSTSSRNTHYQHYDSPLPTQQSFYSNTTQIATYASPRFHQQYESSTTISDLAEPISVFDDIKFPRHRRSNAILFPSVYIPPNPSRRTSANDARLATASAMRERLLNDIQHNISEIDEELFLLERRRHIPSRLSPIAVMRQASIDKKTHSSNDDNKMWPNKPKRIYEVIPRITSESKTTSQYSTPKLTNRTVSYSYIGKYHYGPEIGQTEIVENDPENSDLKSTIDEIPELSSHETFSLDQFRREQSALPPQHRALNFVPEYGNNNEMELNETVEDLYQNNPIDTDIALLSTASSPHHSGSAKKLHIQDFELLIQTAPEPKIEIPSPSPVKPDEISDKNEADSINTMLSKPVKHSRQSTRTQESPSPSQQTIINTKNDTPIEMAHFFSDYGNEGVGEEDLISFDPNHFALPTEGEIVSDDNISNNLIRQSQTSLLNPHSSQEQEEKQQEQQVTIEKNNEQVKETEKKKIHATTKHIISSTSKLPSKNTVPISIYDSRQIQFTRNKRNVKQDHREPSTSKFNMNRIQQSPENKLNHFSIELKALSPTSTQKNPSKSMDSTRQRRASLYHISQIESSSILFQDQSITPSDIRTTSPKQTGQILNNKQQTTVESRRNPALPVPLNSPDFNNIRPSTSRPPTPERRKSIPSIDQNILLTSTGFINFDNPSRDHFHINTERNAPSPLVNLGSQQEIQQNYQSNELKLKNHDQNLSPIIETRKSEHDDLRLPSIFPRHSDTFDTNLTSVDREDTYRQPISSIHNNNELSKPKLTIEDQTKHEKSYSPPIEEEFPFITPSQRRSRLSLIIRPLKPKEKKILNDQSIPQIHTLDFSLLNNNKKSQEQRHVLFSNNISQSRLEENSPLKNWRERVNKILTKRRFPHDKYAHIQSRVNSFANFDHQPRKIMFLPKKKFRAKISSNNQDDTKENKFNKPKQQIPPMKGPTSQISGRIVCFPDGTGKIFHESLNWNVESKLKAYSLENFHYKTRRNDAKLFNKKPKWCSESRLLELKKDTIPRRQILTQTISLQIDELNFHQQESETERKIFDINSNGQQSISKFQESVLSTASFNSKRSDKIIFDEKLVWTKKSILKDSIWKNINYQPKKSTIQIVHQPTKWKSQSKIQITHSLTWDIQAKARYWSEFDLHQLTTNKALFSQYHNPKWNDLITDNNYPLLSLKQDYVDENFNDQLREESPANRPKWNSVSKTRSINTVYNPKLLHSNSLRRGWDLDLQRKRVHKLPPLKRKRDHDEIPQLTIEVPSSNDRLTMNYNYDHSVTMHDRATGSDYVTKSSRRSSRALVPSQRLPDIQLLSETPRSQRPVQQEWYDELSKSRSTHRTDIGRTRNDSVQESIGGSIHQTNSPRELLTLRSSTRNSQNSVISVALLDSSIRTNRATDLRLSRDMEEHHQHSHSLTQCMPMEIRGFELKGTQLTVPDNATIRPLKNINYRTSERVKTRRIYPWSNLHQNGISSRSSSLLPITEFRHPSFETSIVDVPQLIHEE